MKSVHAVLLLAGLAVVAVGAFWLGRASGPASETTLVMAATDPQTPEAPAALEAGAVPGPAAAVAPTASELAEGNSAPGIETFHFDESLATVDELRALMEGGIDSLEKEGRVQSLMQALLNTSQHNSGALAGLLQAYKNDPVSMTGDRLQSILAEIRDPEVEAAALEMANATDPQRQRAGLDLLAQLNIPSAAALDITSRIIAGADTPPDLMMAAIDALPHMPMPESQLESTLGSLNRAVTSSTDPGVRSAGIFKMAELAKDAEDLRGVIDALDADNALDDRISAAMALQQSAVVDGQLRGVLVERMTDAREVWEIRRMAAQALARFKLDGADYAAYEKFLREQSDISLGR